MFVLHGFYPETDEIQGEMRNTIIVLHAFLNEVYYA